jgi:allophanate hydrolase
MLQHLAFTIENLKNAYKNGLSPQEVVDEIFNRIKIINDPNIFINLTALDSLHADAKKLGNYNPNLPLWGIPFAVKDNIDVKKMMTTAGCPEFSYIAKDDAFTVRLLKKAGALMIGKTNLDQFATGLVGVRSPYGAPLNAVDPLIVPGGSSSGSAVSVGHGIVSFSLGTDTAGSGRVPAALNNIVGLKPSLGSLSASGVVPACRTIDTVSVFAMTVEDAFNVFTILNDYDEKDSYSKPFKKLPLLLPQSSIKIGIPDKSSVRFFDDSFQSKSFERNIDKLKFLGFEILPINFEPFYEIAHLLYEGSWVAERYTVIKDLLKKNPKAIHNVTRQIIQKAENFSAADTFKDYYKLSELKRKVNPILTSVKMLCVPSIPTFYSVKDLIDDPITPNSNLGTYTNFVNLLDMCGITVPTDPRKDGRPGSVTLLGMSGDDNIVASTAILFEKNCNRFLGGTKFKLENPNDLQEYNSSYLDIAVCGAHMEGLSLNWQLKDLGAHFVQKSKTSSCYNLFALTNLNPIRPGLLRSSKQDGNAINLEIWKIPKKNFGEFIEYVQPPLGIGSIELEDGKWIKGFLCEKSGIVNAKNISEIGDWREYIKA